MVFCKNFTKFLWILQKFRKTFAKISQIFRKYFANFSRIFREFFATDHVKSPLDKTMSTLLYIITMKSTLLETILVSSFLTHSVIKWKKYQKNWTYPSLEHTEGIFCYMLQKYIFGPLGLIIHATLVFPTLVVVCSCNGHTTQTTKTIDVKWRDLCVSCITHFHRKNFLSEFFSKNS